MTVIQKVYSNDDVPSHDEKHSFLDELSLPSDLRRLSIPDLKKAADATRLELINAVSRTGGHLGAGLGVVELTTALHAVFNTPDDKIIWDVGHQCYPHKILTGRKDRMDTVRKENGLSGFTKRSESEYDPFGAGHSSTSISAGLGMALARDLQDKDNQIIAVIGDGAISGGMAWEALNNAGDLKSRLLVILNDNDMSIAPPVGAMSKYLSSIAASDRYMSLRDTAKQISGVLPTPMKHALKRLEEHARSTLGGGTMFEEMGFYYIGPVDGHNMEHLVPVLQNIRDSKHEGPFFLHVVTQKGKGFAPAENSADKLHAVAKFDVVTGTQSKPKSRRPSYTKVFSESLIREARKDSKIVGITAAMPDGTGLDKFATEFPDRYFDVGIAEQHAVTFAAGLAAEGMKPFAAIYSTFLQRAYDQIIHDVAIQKLPVRFAIDRAGQVGADGATHAGSFDVAYLGCIPNMTLMAAADEVELARMVATAAAYDDGPIAFRYPRGEATGIEMPDIIAPLELGQGRVIKEGTDIALLSYGTLLEECLIAAKMLEQKNISVSVADARFAKPLDTDLVKQLAGNHSMMITIEEGSSGGFGSIVMNELANTGRFDGGNLKFRSMTMPELFLDHASQESQYKKASLDAQGILKLALSLKHS